MVQHSPTRSTPFYNFDGISGTYEVCLTVGNNYQCETTYCEPIVIQDIFNLYVPNTFSPDGNGINDLFGPVVSQDLLEYYELWIFNRWGDIIFYTDTFDEYWDGTERGIKAQQDTYIWLIKYREMNEAGLKTKRGHVNLIR